MAKPAVYYLVTSETLQPLILDFSGIALYNLESSVTL